MHSYRHREYMRFTMGDFEFNDFVLHIPKDEDNERFLEMLSKQPRLDQTMIVEFDPEAERKANVSMAERFDAARGRGSKQQVFKGGAQDSTGMVDGPKDGSAAARQQLLTEQAETDRLEQLRLQNEKALEEADRLKREQFQKENEEREKAEQDRLARVAEEDKRIADEAAAAKAADEAASAKKLSLKK